MSLLTSAATSDMEKLQLGSLHFFDAPGQIVDFFNLFEANI
jgi:hypothetical protein